MPAPRVELLVFDLPIVVDDMNAAVKPAPDQDFGLRPWELGGSARNELEELAVVLDHVVVANLALLLEAEYVPQIDPAIYRTM